MNQSSNGHAHILFAQYQAQKLKDWLGFYNSPGIALLDFGCGNGLMTNFVQEVFYEATVIGVDPSRENIAKAQNAFSNSKFIALANSLLPFDAHSFDLIYTANVLHHIPFDQHSATIKEIMRVLKPTGLLVILELNPYNPWTAYSFATNPIEQNARMLKPSYTRSLIKPFGLPKTWYYSFLPNILSWFIGLEDYIWWLPIGSLYATIVKKQV
jgi:ubiquinone/menaquinone biosynthesis C-methylase UbiE